MTPNLRYPANDITPHGWYYLTQGNQPSVWLSAYDGSVDLHLMGGHSIPDRFEAPECVQIKSGGLKDLIPPWKHIDQKGATQDGVTNIDSLYDPAEPKLELRCYGRDGRHAQRVARDLIASIDAKQPSTLNFLTHDEGHWWGTPRWFQGAPTNPVMGGQNRFQDLSLRLRIDGSFYRSYDDTGIFQFAYQTMSDSFGYDTTAAHNLGANWPQLYSGTGTGYCTANQKAIWVDDAVPPYDGNEVINGPYKDFETATNNQVVNIQIASFLEITLPDGAENHIWARMGRNVDGTWNGYGVKLQIGLFGLTLSRYNNFVETVMREWLMLFPPMPYENWTLVAGYEGDERMFKVMRNGLEIRSHKEPDTGSAVGPNYRGVGFGMRAGAAFITQATPGMVALVSAGDNTTVTQSGFLKRTNIGDQPMYDDYTLFGPGLFRIYDGPGSDDYVEFGPLLPNQVVFLRTDPRSKTPLVQDLTSVPPTPQQLNIFQQALEAFESFAFANNIPPLLQQINSLFGIAPPQGNLYKYLKGRFSDNAAIPAKSPGNPAQPYYVKVSIDDGNASSKIIASGTPLRRYPL